MHTQDKKAGPDGMYPEATDSTSAGFPEVLLDGQPVRLPEGRRSLAAIRSYLDMLALEQQRILSSFTVDGRRSDLVGQLPSDKRFSRVEGKTIDLCELPQQLVRLALQQSADAVEQVQSAVTLVLINNGRVSREFWWELTARLKEPLLTLSLLPESACYPGNAGASHAQLRRWQLQQLGNILKTIDEACWSADPRALSNALENGALPWLTHLHETLSLWNETLSAAARAACEHV